MTHAKYYERTEFRTHFAKMVGFHAIFDLTARMFTYICMYFDVQASYLFDDAAGVTAVLMPGFIISLQIKTHHRSKVLDVFRL